jgi:hypothetical protein
VRDQEACRPSLGLTAPRDAAGVELKIAEERVGEQKAVVLTHRPNGVAFAPRVVDLAGHYSERLGDSNGRHTARDIERADGAAAGWQRPAVRTALHLDHRAARGRLREGPSLHQVRHERRHVHGNDAGPDDDQPADPGGSRLRLRWVDRPLLGHQLQVRAGARGSAHLRRHVRAELVTAPPLEPAGEPASRRVLYPRRPLGPIDIVPRGRCRRPQGPPSPGSAPAAKRAAGKECPVFGHGRPWDARTRGTPADDAHRGTGLRSIALDNARLPAYSPNDVAVLQALIWD